MTLLAGKVAVVTGGGSGIGRELVRQLAAQGASVAMCDISMNAMVETRELCLADGVPQGEITAHLVDVSDEQQVLRFRDDLSRQGATDRVHILINNAGIAGGGSLFTDSREDWDRTFGVCWFGVYYMTRAFLPMVVKADSASIVNVASAAAFWAAGARGVPATAYAAAKFTVKGFTEALITDLKVNAPHVRCSIAMPGLVGTNILANSRMVLAHGTDPDVSEVAQKPARARPNDYMDSAEAARIILDGMHQGRWRILVGPDAEQLDANVRADPDAAYDDDFDTPFN